MAPICYSQILLYSLSVFLFFIPESDTLTFNLSNIGPQHQNLYIRPFHDAYISSQGLQVTSDERSTNLQQRLGKATYFEPLHLWDKSTGNLTDFSTHFTFVIDSKGLPHFADGIAFFLAPKESEGSDYGHGSTIGLPIKNSGQEPSSPFVAVEFDTFQNDDVDPVGISPVTHVGININSLKSNVTAVWYCNITHGIENEAWIRYDSSSFNLSVVFTGSTNTSRVEDTIHRTIDLRDYLPEWVTFGFSAATGRLFEKNTIKSWEFSSSYQRPKKLSPKGVVGLVVGSGVLVGGLVLVGFGLWRKRRAKEEDESEVDKLMENEFQSGAGPKKFSYSQLSQATNNFEEEQKLGEGGFGGVYKGFMSELNSYIAVPECQMRMVEWVWDLYGMGRLLEAVDAKLGTNFDERELERLVIVGLWCAHPDHNLRPNIRQAIHVLSFQAPLPILPPRQPALSFFTPRLNTTTTSSG
ncbi:hypothetical protein RHSIM_Rhsim11G0140600 [Rhododendron simsii]|uniref:Legume lectin domain-containing protein n=1 Tax=Rhododendron simsii TaxID=118357 RepID=A0A834L937_RHOSS|nr:hypothetical protein RHSIM_Rhsim11G0140600 [Rhododendron simsii]